MVKKSMIVGIILLLGITLVACRRKENKDLFEQEQEPNILTWEGESPTVAEEAATTIKPEVDETSNQLGTTSSSDQFDPIENDSEGEVMATLGNSEEELFYYEEIDNEIKARIQGKSYGDTCEVPYEELRYVKVLHWGFDGDVHSGELIVNKTIAEDIIEIFKELYELEYPVERMVLVDEYEADDNASMADNNSSAFNYRKVEGTDRLSLHSYGMAIDINPFYNPYIHEVEGKTVVTPENGAQYEDRTLDCPYYIDTEDPCYLAFTKRGFTWGGAWKNSKDYQHFQKALQ